MSWSLEEVKEAEDTLLRIENLLSSQIGAVSHSDVVEAVGHLAELMKKVIADKKNDSEADALAENMDENGD